ncbi:4-hydroxybenzoate transporter [Acetivibrio straminisolvens JCM 21531]|uniref:4-hydroxybenzoate transporter n=2 Tax=Acetivibrio straminisolvens TaxID=253314 RepID=W4V8W1_9FIRM|nr:4-hydroxybenzoate transporter [Acetivibrio straminisolvens JCM 21531]
MGIVLGIISSFSNEPDNYVITMILFQLFVIPSVIAYYKVSKNSKRDITKVRSILRKRAKNIP